MFEEIIFSSLSKFSLNYCGIFDRVVAVSELSKCLGSAVLFICIGSACVRIESVVDSQVHFNDSMKFLSSAFKTTFGIII